LKDEQIRKNLKRKLRGTGKKFGIQKFTYDTQEPEMKKATQAECIESFIRMRKAIKKLDKMRK
jgi:hypothetical protein